MLDSNKVKSKLSTEDIIKICCHLQGSDDILYDTQGHPIFASYLDHAGATSRKLYYYPETGLFRCYTGSDESYDLFELVSRATGGDFRSAFDYVVKFFNIKEDGFGESENQDLINDWDIFQKIQDYSCLVSGASKPEPLQENLLEYFYTDGVPEEWLREDISADVMRHYGIRIDDCLQKIILPQRDEDGNLVGIRGRSFNPVEINNGKKYMPVIIQGQLCNTPASRVLFGFYENKEAIKRTKRVLIVEGEKSVLKLATMYGTDNCWAVATYGSALSEGHIQMLLGLGVTEIVLGYDREYDGGRGAPDTTEYEEKLLKIVKPLTPYVNVGIIMDYDHLTGKKDSPVDKGKETFEKLFHKRIRIPTESLQIEKGKRRNV